MNLDRDELCILQQALGLREMTIINSDALLIRVSEDYAKETEAHNLLMKTKKLRQRVIQEIRCLDKYPEYQEHE